VTLIPVLGLIFSLTLAQDAPVLPAGASPASTLNRYPLAPGGTVAVENVQGDIAVEGWDRAEVEVAVVKTPGGPGADPESVRIGVEFDRHGLTVRTLYPGESRDEVRVDYRLKVPRQVRLDRLRTLEGNIFVRDVEGAVDARTLNGSIQQAGVSGSILARTVNGDVLISLRALPDPLQPVLLETVSGDVELVLPPQPGADLQLSTVAGSIESRYAFSASSTPGDTSYRARLGQGGPLVRLRTVRGNIRVHEQEDAL
jgi:hypothetical protein